MPEFQGLPEVRRRMPVAGIVLALLFVDETQNQAKRESLAHNSGFLDGGFADSLVGRHRPGPAETELADFYDGQADD